MKKTHPKAFYIPNRALLAAGLATCLAIPTTHADNIDWIGGDGSFNDPDNWLQGTVPGAGEIADIGDDLLAQNTTVDLDADVAVRSVTVSNGMWLRFNENTITTDVIAYAYGRNEISPGVFRPSKFLIDGNGVDTILNTNTLQINAGAEVKLFDNAFIEVRDHLRLDGSQFFERNFLSGEGRIDMTFEGDDRVLFNNGTIIQLPTTSGVPLHLRATNGGLFDLDGQKAQAEDGRISVGVPGESTNERAKIIFEADGLTDDVQSQIDIAGGNEIVMDIANGWTLDTFGTISLYEGNGLTAKISGTQVNIKGRIVAGSPEPDETIADWLIDDTTISPGAEITIRQGDLLEFKTATQTVVNGGTFELREDANLDFEGPTHINGGTFIQDDGDGRIDILGETTYRNVIQFDGLVQQWGDATVAEDTTIFNLGTFNVEASPGGTTHWTLDADLNLNVGAINALGLFSDTTDADFTFNHTGGNAITLNVNLLGRDLWTHEGTMIVNAEDNELIAAMIDGDDIEMRGSYFLQAGATWLNSRVELDRLIASPSTDPGSVFIAQDASMWLHGGSIENPNVIDDGIIQGLGELYATEGKALVGRGQILTPMTFFGDAELRADDGQLDLWGEILDVGTLGTNDTDGVLDVKNPWSTSIADKVELRGGVIQGQKITNDGSGGIVGFGEVTAEIDNRSFIAARDGGTLVINNPDTDWDGIAGDGQLFALQGDLHLRGIAENNGFNGDVGIGSSYELFIDGFNLDFASNSQTQFNGGTLRSDTLQTFGGQTAVFLLEAHIDSEAVFEAGSSNQLNARMSLHGDTLIQAGAEFNGTADLTNRVSSALTLADGAELNVELRSLGDLIIEDGIGFATVNDDVSSSNRLHLELAGNTFPDYDRLEVKGAIALRGLVDVDLLGYDPVAGDLFDVLDFNEFIDNGYGFDLPELNPGLAWDTTEFESLGYLKVVPEPTSIVTLAVTGLFVMRRRRSS